MAGFVADRSAYVAPPADGRGVEVRIDPKSERLQALHPWPAWDGADFMDMPVLAKAKGKTTTDQISPAGPWLALRGHLDRFSDNMLSGAVNAFTGARGKGRNVLSGRDDEAFSAIARQYRAAGLRWVVIGDANYGEGSSREHAALSPRLLGGGAVVARSFARIHETNLKKQGVLPLTFADPADYDKVRADDRISVLGLADLAPDAEVTVVLEHAGGSRDQIATRHSMSTEQIAWFRAGSTLNLIRAQNVGA